MVQNFPGPWQVEVDYTVDTLDHVMRLNCDVTSDPAVGDDFSTIQVDRRLSGAEYLDTLVDAFVALLQPAWTADCTFNNAHLFKYTPLSFERTWYSSYGIGVDGTHAGVYSKANETITTYRTQEGGIFRLTMEELFIDFFGKSSLAAAGAYQGDLRDFILGGDNWILARDTSYPVWPLYLLHGQNEAIFKRRYR